MEGSVFIAITIPDEPLGIMQFLTVGRSLTLPYGAEWIREGWWKREASDANIFSEVSKAHQTATGYKLVAFEDIPPDRTFRDALAHDGTKLYHDMPKAREIHRTHIRQYRALKLAYLDVEYELADEANDADEKKRVVAAKQELLDLPAHPGIEAATTTDELKAVWSPLLNGGK